MLRHPNVAIQSLAMLHSFITALGCRLIRFVNFICGLTPQNHSVRIVDERNKDSHYVSALGHRYYWYTYLPVDWRPSIMSDELTLVRVISIIT
ncbi:hypothetical protein FPV67DRAFT_1529493 [Lyophyllum atratum]|nr:hypothetical protein FPV67DRAFT_1529493 [Lyophyllum atratum]